MVHWPETTIGVAAVCETAIFSRRASSKSDSFVKPCRVESSGDSSTKRIAGWAASLSSCQQRTIWMSESASRLASMAISSAVWMRLCHCFHDCLSNKIDQRNQRGPCRLLQEQSADHAQTARLGDINLLIADGCNRILK